MLQGVRKLFKLIKKGISSFVSAVLANKPIALLPLIMVIILFLSWQINRQGRRLLERPSREIKIEIEADFADKPFFPPEIDQIMDREGIDQKMMEAMRDKDFVRYGEKMFVLWNRIDTELAPYIKGNEKLEIRFKEINREAGNRFREIQGKLERKEITDLEEIIRPYEQFLKETVQVLEDFIKLVEQTKEKSMNIEQ